MKTTVLNQKIETEQILHYARITKPLINKNIENGKTHGLSYKSWHKHNFHLKHCQW